VPSAMARGATSRPCPVGAVPARRRRLEEHIAVGSKAAHSGRNRARRPLIGVLRPSRGRSDSDHFQAKLTRCGYSAMRRECSLQTKKLTTTVEASIRKIDPLRLLRVSAGRTLPVIPVTFADRLSNVRRR